MPNFSVLLREKAHDLRTALMKKQGIAALRYVVENLAVAFPSAEVRIGVPTTGRRMRAVFWLQDGRPVPGRRFWDLALEQVAALRSERGFWSGGQKDARCTRLIVRLGMGEWWGTLELLLPSKLAADSTDLLETLKQIADWLARDFLLWRLEEALQRQNEQQALLHASAPVWIFWLTPEGQFRVFSEASEQYTGRPADYFKAHPARLLRLVHPKDRKKFHQHREDILLEREAVFDFRLLHPAGAVSHLRHMCRPVYGPDGQYLGRIGANQDLTAFRKRERQLQARLRRFEILYELTQCFAAGMTAAMYARNVLQVLQRNLQWHFAAIWQYDLSHDRFHVLAAMQDGASDEAALCRQIDRQVRTSNDGVIGSAVQKRQAIRVGDLSQDPRSLARNSPARSGLYVPLMVYENPIGALAMESREAYAFLDEDLELLETVAGYVASVLENIRLLETVNQKVTDLSALYEATRRLSLRRLDAEAVYEIIHQAVTRLMPFDALVLVLYDEKRRYARAVYLYENGQHYAPIILPLGEGLAGRVWRERRPLIFRDYSRSRQMREKRYVFGPEDKVVRSVLAVPLKTGGQLLGMLAVQSYQRGLYGERELSLLQNLSSQAAVALENASLFAARQRSIRQMEAIADVLRLLAGPPLDRRESLHRILERALSVIPNAEKGTLILRQPDGAYRIQVAVGYQNTALFQHDFGIETGYAGRALREGKPILAQDALQHYPPPFDGELEEANQVLCGMSVPLFDDERVIGAICVDNCTTPTAFQEEDLALLESFAHTASAVLSRLQHLDELQQRLQQLERLARLAALIRASDTPEDVWRMACNMLAETFHLRLAMVFIRRADGNLLARFVAGENAAAHIGFCLSAEGDSLRRVLDDGQPLILENAVGNASSLGEQLPWMQKNDSLAVWPLYDEAQTIGALMLVRAHPFSEAEQATLTMTAQMLGNAATRSRLLRESREYAAKLAAIHVLGQNFAEAQDLPQIYRRLLQSFQEWFKEAQDVRVLRFDTALDAMRLVAQGATPTEPIQFLVEKITCPFWNFCQKCESEEVTLTTPAVVEGGAGVKRRFWCLSFSLPGQEYGRGALQFSLPPEQAVASQDAKLLGMVARLAAAEIANQEYLQSIQQDAARWEMLVENGREMVAAFSRDDLYRKLHHTAQQVFGCRQVQVFLLEANQERLKLVFARPETDEHLSALADSISLAEMPYESPFLKSFRMHRAVLEHVDGGSQWYAPVLYGSREYGVLLLRWAHRYRPARGEPQMVESLASQLAVALRNFELREGLEARLQHLESLRSIDTAIISSTDPRIVLDLIVREIMRLAEADIVSILYFDDETRQFRYYEGRGYTSPAFTDLSAIGVGHPAFQSLVSIKPICLYTPYDWHKFGGIEARLLAENVKNAAYYPLVAKENLQGVLEVCFRTPRQLDAAEKQFVETLANQAAIAIENFHLLDALEKSNRELRMAYDETIEGWALALEMRDRETEGHTRRVTDLTVRLARRLGIPEGDIVHIRRGALLHDIGKMGIPDAILHKPGKLTEEEWRIMRRHPELALSFLSRIVYLRPALDIPYSHHEKWDGSGYPLGLKGEQIPLAARLFAIADVYDALATDRPYRKAWPREKVLQYIAEQSGKHFDPRLVEEFLAMLREEE